MPNYTKTIQLEKPLQTETYDVDKRNANWDKIDAAITEDRDSADKHSKNPSAHANGIAGNAGSATKLKTARQITLSGDVSGSAYFDGSSNMCINVVGNHSAKADRAKLADSAVNAGSAYTADRLLTERAITLTGDVNGIGTFDGSQALEIVTTLAKESGIIDGNVSNPDAWWVKLGGKFPLIIQGGIDRNQRSPFTITLPISFNKCVFAVATPFAPSPWSRPIVTKSCTSRSVTFCVDVRWASGDYVMWLALGS